MSSTYTDTGSQTFTRAHARKISYRVVTDLNRMRRFYGKPSGPKIDQYDRELVEVLTVGFLERVTYGFRRGDAWIEPTLRYTAFELGNPGLGDDPGKVRPGADIKGATFYTYLVFSQAWFDLSAAEKSAFEKTLPFVRGGATEPGIDGYLQQDLAYSAGGRGLQRATVRSW